MFVTGPWELESEFSHKPGMQGGVCDIAVCPNQDIAVVEIKGYRVCVYSNDTFYKFNLNLKQGMDPEVKPLPKNVTVNADGIIYVTCQCYVLMYTVQGVYKDRWVAMSPDNKPSNTEATWLHGLTIDHKSQLLVGQVKSPWYISKHRQDGSHIGSSITVDIEPRYLAATSHDTTVISNGSHVQIVDSTGDVLHTLNTNREVSFWHPNGVICHNDIIMVCTSDRTTSHEISCFSVSAEYLGSIPVNDWPYSVTIAQDSSKLLIACFKGSVQVYKNKALSL